RHRLRDPRAGEGGKLPARGRGRPNRSREAGEGQGREGRLKRSARRTAKGARERAPFSSPQRGPDRLSQIVFGSKTRGLQEARAVDGALELDVVELARREIRKAHLEELAEEGPGHDVGNRHRLHA